MKNTFVKKYWSENDIMFYIHFENNTAIAQIEISSDKSVFLSIDSPIVGESMLYDQDLSSLELENEDYISRDTFFEAWNKR